MYQIKAKIAAPRCLSLSKARSGPGDSLPLKSQQEGSSAITTPNREGHPLAKYGGLKTTYDDADGCQSCLHQKLFFSTDIISFLSPTALWGRYWKIHLQELSVNLSGSHPYCPGVDAKVGNSPTAPLWGKLYKASQNIVLGLKSEGTLSGMGCNWVIPPPGLFPQRRLLCLVFLRAAELAMVSNLSLSIYRECILQDLVCIEICVSFERSFKPPDFVYHYCWSQQERAGEKRLFQALPIHQAKITTWNPLWTRLRRKWGLMKQEHFSRDPIAVTDDFTTLGLPSPDPFSMFLQLFYQDELGYWGVGVQRCSLLFMLTPFPTLVCWGEKSEEQEVSIVLSCPVKQITKRMSVCSLQT